MNLRCKDCEVTFDSPYNKDCPFCGSDAFVVQLLHENKETEPDYWMIRGEIWSDDIAFLEAHNGTSSEVQAAMDEWENYAVPLYKSPATTDKLSVEKLQEQLNTAKKALTEIEKMYQKQRDRFLNSEMNESARSHCESQLKLLFPAHKAYEVLAAIGGDDD
ncbi:hypothetical protein [Lactococcus lactis]|uniref:hypothetical protein n=1 Tax=Lactococcus lactis TaxID=1358 RepID=UPI000BF96E1A|nr:hypothetical protein [Lactococcus lactis]PFG86669.1 hypothetical protein BW153_04660 [Lactococcus lactis]